MDRSRRLFLRGRVAPTPAAQRPPPRPPWAGDDDERFLNQCDRCHACVPACPKGLVRVGDGGFPTIDFSTAGCDFCGRCATACQPRALDSVRTPQPWRAKASISADCLALRRIECRVCAEMCDANAIRFRPQLGGVSTPAVQMDACTGCGECVRTCPTHALSMEAP